MNERHEKRKEKHRRQKERIENLGDLLNINMNLKATGRQMHPCRSE